MSSFLFDDEPTNGPLSDWICDGLRPRSASSPAPESGPESAPESLSETLSESLSELLPSLAPPRPAYQVRPSSVPPPPSSSRSNRASRALMTLGLLPNPYKPR
jgi:hypothetical protein